MNGFAHPDYAASLAEFGDPRELPLSGGWVLERPIPGFPCRDAMGCYPLFACRDWSKLQADLLDLQDDLVSLSLVTDPFGHYDLDLLDQCFDVVIHFKEHHVADLDRPMNKIVSSHHRYYARKALKSLSVDICEEPIRHLDEWISLYGSLAARFNVSGLRAFSVSAFEKQLSLPGAFLFRAIYEDTVVGAHLVYLNNGICYGHLAGINSIGQDLMASYALYQAEIDYFVDKAQWFDWGGGIGSGDGLAQFKRGWSTESRPAYLCGRIFDKKQYSEIVAAKGIASTDYFPAYRKGEFW